MCVYICIYIYIYIYIYICKRDTLSEAVVSLRIVVTFVTWLIFRTKFLIQKVFCNAILFKIHFVFLKEN